MDFKHAVILAWLLAAPLVAQTAPDWKTVPGARIQVLINANTSEGQFNDSLYYTPAQWATIKQADINVAKAARVANWVAFVQQAKSKPPVEPTLEELVALKVEIEKQLVDVIARIAKAQLKVK